VYHGPLSKAKPLLHFTARPLDLAGAGFA